MSIFYLHNFSICSRWFFYRTRSSVYTDFLMPIAFFPKAIYFIISINIHHYQSQLGVMLKSQKCLGDYFILIKPYI